MPDRLDLETEEIALDLARLAYRLSSERMTIIFHRYGVESKKYNPAQPRVPAKQHGGGQWTKAPSNNASVIRAGARALGTIAANPEAASTAGAAILPALIGGIGISRAAGLNAVIQGGGSANGMGMTPILGLPFQIPLTMTNPLSGRTQEEQGKIDEDCEEQYEKDTATCQMNAAMYAKRTMYSSSQIYAICMQQARSRYNQCRYDGGVEHITIPLFDGRKIK